MKNNRRPQLTNKIKAALNNCLGGLIVVLLFGGIALSVLSSRHTSVQASNGQSDQAAQSKGSKNTHPSKHIDSARRLAASYYSLKDGSSATLMLSNQGPHPMDIRVVLFNLAGDRLDLPSVTLEPTTVRNYDLGQWAAMGDGSFQEGSLQVLYNGMDMELGGAVKMINAKKSLILDEELSEPGMDFASTRLEGVWWLPSRKAELRLALSNVTKSYLTVTVTVEQNDARIITLNPHETRIINLSHGEGNFGGVKLRQFGGISISHLGFKGALLARGFVTDANVGYSQVVEFKDPNRAKSSSLNGAGLRLGTLYGKALHPIAVARNTGSAPTIVTGRIRYTASDGTPGVVNLPEVDLAAGETKTIDVETAANSIGSLQNLVAGLEFDYTTAPGSVIIAVESYSTDDNQVYRVSIVDAKAEMSSTGKYPWNLNNGASTVVYIKNVTDQEQQYYLYANYKGGFWILGVKTIAPHQTFALDMRQIKEQQIKDEKGNTLPADAMEGQVFWSGFGKQNLVLIGRVEQIEAGGGMSFTTACGTCCFPEFVQGVVLPSTTTDAVGNSTQFYAYNQYADCYGCPYPSLTGAYNVTWSTNDPTIATISANGLATAVGAGTTMVVANWTAENWYYNPMGGYDPDSGYCGGYNGGGGGGCDSPYGECDNAPSEVTVGSSYSGVNIAKIQYQSGNNYIDITDTLYILKGTTVTFKAIPNPASIQFPSGKPVWSGSYGNTGTGATTTVTFSLTSSSATDYQTVTATAGNSVTVNVVVFDLIGLLTPEDNFQGRNQSSYGLVEKVDLGSITIPFISASQAGGLRWKITSGQGTLNNTDNGVDTYTAPRTSQSVTLKLEIESGPSIGLGRSFGRTIVAPSGATMKLSSDVPVVIHCYGFSSVGFYGDVFLLPKDVSFANLTFREGGGTLQATGLYASQNNAQHSPTGFMSLVRNCNIADGCKAFLDTVYTGKWSNPNSGSAWPTGVADWPIDWLYAFNSDLDPVFNGQTKFMTATHHQESDTVGTATIYKDSSPTFTKNVADPDSSCQ